METSNTNTRLCVNLQFERDEAENDVACGPKFRHFTLDNVSDRMFLSQMESTNYRIVSASRGKGDFDGRSIT